MNDKVICMFADDAIKKYATLTETINRKYASENKCDFRIQKRAVFKDRHPAWERVPLILSLLKNKKYKYVIYIDADAYFRTKHFRTNAGTHFRTNALQYIIDTYKSYDIIFSGDLSQLINTGFMIIKNTKFSYKFFWELMKNETFKNKYYERTWDQDCSIQLYNTNFKRAKKKCVILDYGVLQSYNIQHNEKSLIVHHEKKTTEERFRLISEELISDSCCYIKISHV